MAWYPTVEIQPPLNNSNRLGRFSYVLYKEGSVPSQLLLLSPETSLPWQTSILDPHGIHPLLSGMRVYYETICFVYYFCSSISSKQYIMIYEFNILCDIEISIVSWLCHRAGSDIQDGKFCDFCQVHTDCFWSFLSIKIKKIIFSRWIDTCPVPGYLLILMKRPHLE